MLEEKMHLSASYPFAKAATIVFRNSESTEKITMDVAFEADQGGLAQQAYVHSRGARPHLFLPVPKPLFY